MEKNGINFEVFPTTLMKFLLTVESLTGHLLERLMQGFLSIAWVVSMSTTMMNALSKWSSTTV